MATAAVGSGTRDERRLGTGGKIVFGWGDHAVNVALSSISFFFLFFLTDGAGLQPLLAGAVVWVARLFDAVTDPAMGRLSDRTKMRAGRRRPYFLIGAIPLGLFYMALWQTPFESQGAMFAYYLPMYMGVSLSLTVLSVPYIALLPEMALGYDERTSVNTFRAVLTLLGSVVAASMFLWVRQLGGGAEAYGLVAVAFGLWLILPWPFVFRVTFERTSMHREDKSSLREALDALRKHGTYWRLSSIYIATRIAIDLASLSMPYFFTHWIGRPELFFPSMLMLLGAAALSLPVWLRIAQSREKHQLMVIGMAWWAGCSLLMFLAQPDWPTWLLLGFPALLGFGFAIVDLMPWAMLGETIDEGQLQTGTRRDGIYSGFFTFLRKAGGATATLLAGGLLQLVGYREEPPQPEAALLAIRCLMTLVPVACLALAAWAALRYPLDRARHIAIQKELEARLARRDRSAAAN